MALITALMPAYKEPGILAFRERLLKALLPHKPFNIVWLVGDLPTCEKLEGAIYPPWERIIWDSGRGLGRALKTGFREIGPETEWVLTMDTDGQQDPAEFEKFWTVANEGVNYCTQCMFHPEDRPALVAGDYQILDERSRYRKLISKLATKALVWRHGLGLSNITSDYRLYRADAVRELMARDPPKYDDFACVPEIVVRLHRLGYRSRLVNVPISFTTRKEGVSHARLSARQYLGLLR